MVDHIDPTLCIDRLADESIPQARPDQFAHVSQAVKRSGRSAYDVIAYLAVERDKLAAIVAKLPKTADGVPIVHPMPLYVRGGEEVDGVSAGLCHEWYYVGAKRHASVYSTRSAALAASQSKTGEQEGGAA